MNIVCSQRGFTLTGLVIFLGLIIGAVVLGSRAAPPWTEYMTIKRTLSRMATNGSGTDPSSIRRDFDSQAQIDGVETISGKSLVIANTGSGYRVSAEWERRAHLFGNTSLVFDFAVEQDLSRR